MGDWDLYLIETKLCRLRAIWKLESVFRNGSVVSKRLTLFAKQTQPVLFPSKQLSVDDSDNCC